jgi:hypothetical protein
LGVATGYALPVTIGRTVGGRTVGGRTVDGWGGTQSRGRGWFRAKVPASFLKAKIRFRRKKYSADLKNK